MQPRVERCEIVIDILVITRELRHLQTFVDNLGDTAFHLVFVTGQQQNDDGTLHSLMDRRSPERLVLPYTAAMMAALLFIDAPRSVSMLGLGAGSQARFLRHYRPRRGRGTG